MTIVTASKWTRVDKGNLCPICGKPNWCMISADGEAAICARIQSDKRAGDAGWLHRLDGKLAVIKPQIKSTKQLNRASIEVLDTAYKSLFSILSLSNRHFEKLMGRGLNPAQIKSLNYKTLPLEDRPFTVRDLVSHGVQLQGIPGFWRDTKGWRLGGQPGILIPVKDIQGRIVGTQIRCDDNSTGKYKWLSSSDKPNGCSSGSPIHVAQPTNADTSEVWITEGPIKADIASLKLDKIVLAVPGVGNWSGTIPIIEKIKPIRAIVAFDMDKTSNSTVKLYSEALITYLIKRGIRTFEADWDASYKGIDDLLTGEKLCQR